MAPGLTCSPMLVHLATLDRVEQSTEALEPMKVKQASGRRRGRPGRSARSGVQDSFEPLKVTSVQLSSVKVENMDEPMKVIQGLDEFNLLCMDALESCKLDEVETKSVDTKSTSAGDISQDEDDIIAPQKTAVVVRNIPKVFGRSELAEILNAEGFQGAYDLIYVPCRLETRETFGYAFVNLISEDDAISFMDHFRGCTKFQHDDDLQRCDVEWSSEQGGLAAHIERYRNSSMMHVSVPEHLKPAIYHGGLLAPFPAPTRALKKPRASCRKK